jgi:hypothetical protein
MRYIEIVPRNGSHYIVADGKEINRHNSIEIAEAVRLELIRQELDSAKVPPDPQDAYT